ncbi:MAG: cell division protein FtsX [Candidatus Dormibacteria bacterium]
MPLVHNFVFGLRSAWQNFWRNAAVSIAAVFVMTLLLMVMGLLFSITHTVTQVSDYYKAKLDTVSVYIPDTIPLVTILEMQHRLSLIPTVHDISITSKNQALSKFRTQPGTAAIVQELQSNPLPASLEVTVFHPDQLKHIDDVARTWRSCDPDTCTGFQAQKVERILNFFTIMDVGLLAVILALTVVSTFIIMSTIRTAVYVRRVEIEIMKLVGATDWFVRWPFILEGMMGGLIASAVAALTIQANRPLLDKVQGMAPYIPISYDPQFQVSLLLVIFAAGLGLGAVGSYIGVRRFLRV